MKQITIRLSDELDARLRLEAERRGVPMAVVAREAIDRHVPHGHLSFAAIGDGSPRDASVRVDTFVAKYVGRRH